MNFEVQKITVPLRLGAYDAAYESQSVAVWVNLPAALRQKRLTLLRGFAAAIAQQVRADKRAPAPWRARAWARVRGWFWKAPPYAETEQLMTQIWSAGAETDGHWSVAEIRALQEADPLLYAWMTRESWRMIDEWQDARKKK